MKLITRLFLAVMTLAMVFGMAACSAGSSSNGADTKANTEDNQRFLQEYGAIFGRYKGTVSANPIQNVEVAIYWVPVPTGGRDSRGQPLFRNVAKARYTRLSSTQPDYILDVRYTAETAEVQMSIEPPKPPSGSQPPDTSVAFLITGNLVGTEITGVVVVPGGVLGNINLTRVSGDSSAPPEGDVEQRNQRLRELYRPLEGDYTGQTVFVGPDSETLKFTMKLYVVDAPATDGTTIPILLSYYRRANDPTGNVALTMDCTFNTNTNPPTINMISRPYPGPPNNYKISVTARVRGNTITGSFTEAFKARTGTMTLTKKSATMMKKK